MGLPLEDPELQAVLIEDHRFHKRDNSPMPSDWDAKLHRHYLKEVAAGNEINTVDLTRILNQERARYYGQKALDNLAPTERMLTREEIKQFIADAKTEQDKTDRLDAANAAEKQAASAGYSQKVPQDSSKTRILSEAKPADWKTMRAHENALSELESPSVYAH